MLTWICKGQIQVYIFVIDRQWQNFNFFKYIKFNVKNYSKLLNYINYIFQHNTKVCYKNRVRYFCNILKKYKTEIERIPRGIYTREFQEQAVRLHEEVNRKTIPEITKRLHITEGDTKELNLCGSPQQGWKVGKN